MRHLSDADLLQQLRQRGAAEAFEALYDRYARPLHRLAYQKTQSDEVAAEIVQDVFVSLWEKRDNLLITNLEHYLLSAVRYQVINHLRAVIAERKFTDTEAVELPSATLAHQPLDAGDLQRTLDQALQHLPKKTRLIFEMSRYEQLPNREIAHQLDLSEKAVEYHITQAIKHLRVHLRDFLVCLLGLLLFIDGHKS